MSTLSFVCIVFIIAVNFAVSQAKICPYGWKRIGSSCYYFSKTKATGFKAKAACLRRGSFLAVPKTKLENTALFKFANSKKIYGALIGIIWKKYYAIKKGKYIYANWAPKSKGSSKKSCVRFASRSSSKWKYVSCKQRNYYICQLPKYVLKCGENKMSFSVLKTLLDVSSTSQLQLIDKSCHPRVYKSYYVFTTKLTGCGTFLIHQRGKAIAFYNKVLESYSGFNNTISRSKEILLPFACYYPRHYILKSSAFGLKDFSIKKKLVVKKRIIPLTMTLYTDSLYKKPLSKVPALGNRIYVEVKRKNYKKTLSPFGIKYVSCIVLSKYKKPKKKFGFFTHTLISKGCRKDKTVTFHPIRYHKRARFSFLLFRFRGLHYYYSRIVCTVSLCAGKSCRTKGCQYWKKGKRSIPEYTSDQPMSFFN